jgi:hypothetical protein
MDGSMSEKSGSSPFAASVSNWENGTTCVAIRSLSRGKWMSAWIETTCGSLT